MSGVPVRPTADAASMERLIGRLLIGGTYVAMASTLIGVGLMLAGGTDPLAHGAIPPFHPATVLADLLALRPLGFLWSGVILVILLPIGRVAVAGVGFLAARDRRMAGISLLVLLVVLISVAAALGLEG